MKVYKFNSSDFIYAYSGQDVGESKKALFEDFGEMEIDKVEEIPESEWDKKTINIWEDNDMTTEPCKVSIRDSMSGNTPVQIFTNEPF